MKRVFTPFDETLDPKYLTWANEDRTDNYIPDIQGFITDFLYSTRGREVASVYAVWGALYMISSVLQRDAWYVPPEGDNWVDKDYLNIFSLFIGPAGSGKTATINIIQKILTGCNIRFMESENPFLRRKHYSTVGDVSTPEAFLGSISRHAKDEENKGRRKIVGIVDNREVVLKAWSNANALLSEFGALLNKKKYNETMSTNLLTLYDCPSLFTWNTVKRGNVFMPDVFLNILGASTADGLTSNVDPKVLEDGFMSRVVMIYVDDYVRKRPFRFRTQASFQTIIDRLMWIAENKNGEYTLTREAEEWFFNWYEKFMVKMNRNPEKAGYLIRNRTLIIKIAALLKISEYTFGYKIEIRHLQAAEKLISLTYGAVSDLIGYFTDAQLGAARRALEALLVRSTSGVTRQTIAKRITRFRSDTIDGGLKDLWLRGQIKVINDSGEEKGNPQFYPNERYIYERIKYKYENLDSGIFNGSENVVPIRDASDENSVKDEQKPVGDLPHPKESWSGHFPRDEGAEA